MTGAAKLDAQVLGADKSTFFYANPRDKLGHLVASSDTFWRAWRESLEHFLHALAQILDVLVEP